MTPPATRRTVLATMAAAAMPTLASAADEKGVSTVDTPGDPQQDPIFAAIAEHTDATIEMLRTGKVLSTYSDTDPPLPVAEAAALAGAAWLAETEALVNVKPTTRQGVMALLEHVVKFDTGQFTLDSAHYTEADMWPTGMTSNNTNLRGSPLVLPFGHWVLHTVHEALAKGVP